MASEKDQKEREILLARYEQLDDISQKILQLASVIYTPVSRTDLGTCTTHAGIKNTEEKNFTTVQLKPYIERFSKKGVWFQEQGKAGKCHPLIAEVLTRQSIKDGSFETYVEAMRYRWPEEKDASWYSLSQDEFTRDMRIAVYRGDEKVIAQLSERYRKMTTYSRPSFHVDDVFFNILNNPFEAKYLLNLPTILRQDILVAFSSAATVSLACVPEIIALTLQECRQQSAKFETPLPLYGLKHLYLQGKFSDALDFIDNVNFGQYADGAVAMRGQISFLQGDTTGAIALFEEGLKLLKKRTGKRKIFFLGTEGLLFILALLDEGSQQRRQEGLNYISVISSNNNFHYPAYMALQKVLKLKSGDLTTKQMLLNQRCVKNPDEPWATLMIGLSYYWANLSIESAFRNGLIEDAQRAAANGYHWLEMQIYDLVSRLSDTEVYAQKAEALHKKIGGRLLADVVESATEWEIALEALENFNAPPETTQEKGNSEYRLAWFINFEDDANYCVIQPREQKITKSGAWSKGRNVALKRLKESPGELPYLLQQDLRVATHIESHNYSYGYYGKTEYVMGEEAIVALIGHPYTFWEGTTTRVDIVEGQAELRVTKGRKGKLNLQLEPSPSAVDDKNYVLAKETPTRLKIILALRGGEMCVCDIAAHRPGRQSQ